MKKSPDTAIALQVTRLAMTRGAARQVSRSAKLRVACGVICIAVWPLAAASQILNDPTRPPNATPGAGAGDVVAPAAPILQSVRISPDERSAMIGGEVVKLGDKYRDAKVTKITESEVVLSSATGVETLRLYPDIGVKPAATPASVPASKANSKPKRPTRPNAQGKTG